MLGGTTTPDSRGRTRFALDASAGRLTGAVSGLNVNTVGSGGGDQNPQQHTHTISITDPGHSHGVPLNAAGGTGFVGASGAGSLAQFPLTNSAVTGITATAANSGTGGSGNVPPAYMGGITMIRAG